MRTPGKVGLFAIAFVIIFLLCAQFIPRFPMGPINQYGHMTDEQKANPIPYDVLSNETLHRFAYRGPTPTPKTYIKARIKYDSVRDCLVRSERNKPDPDLRLVNWGRFNSDGDVNVCMWRVFNSLGSPEAAEKWLKFQDFEILERHPAAKPVPPVTRIVKGTYYTRNRDKNRASLHPAKGIFKFIKPWGHHISIGWQPSKTPGESEVISFVSFDSTML